MDASIKSVRFATRLPNLAVLTFASGVAGMIISFVFLASAHLLDVIAGAAGFVAGSILVAAGVVSQYLQDRTIAERTNASSAMDFPKSRAHFQRNRENRPEPAWDRPVTLAAEIVRPLVKSLEQFQLGDGGGPAYLIAHDRERFLAAGEGTRELVDLWFAEEREHSRLLGAAVTLRRTPNQRPLEFHRLLSDSKVARRAI